jgi:hypothetical protein
MLAQIAREALVRDLATRLTADFARNLDRQLSGATRGELSKQARSVCGLTLIFDVLRMRARRIANRRVELAEAGKLFLEEASEILSRVDTAAALARRIHRLAVSKRCPDGRASTSFVVVLESNQAARILPRKSST